MPYYINKHILFIHIPKTGGTSVENYLKQNDVQLLYSFFGNKLFPTKELQRYSLQHQTYKTIYEYRDLCKIRFDNRLRIISIVRNPYNRLVSDLFFFNLIKHNTSQKEVYNILKKYIKSERVDNHNTPQYKFVTDKTNKLIPNIRIFRTETLTRDMHNYGFKNFNKWDHIGKQNSIMYLQYLNRESINLINSYYDLDFKLFYYKKL